MSKFLGTILLLLFPATALAAPRTFSEFVNMIVNVLNSGVMVLVTLALATYFFGISTNMFSIREDAEAKRRYFFWGILVLFVMVSVWGILALIQNTVLGSGFDGGAGGGPEDFCDVFGNCGFE